MNQDGLGLEDREALRNNDQRPLLGDAVSSVSPDVHERMRRLAAEGALPVTAPDQRGRAQFTSGSTYGQSEPVHTP